MYPKLVISLLVAALCVGQSLQQDNVALGKPTVQESTGWDGPSSLAVDGDTDGQYFVGAKCAHTHANPNTWWAVDLEAAYDIERVIIYNREDCCAERLHDVDVYITDYLPAEGDIPDPDAAGSVRCNTFVGPGTAGQVVNVVCGSVVRGQYVVVQINGGAATHLQLCEVEVIAAENVAVGGVASQSSQGWNGDPNRGVDGNTDPGYWGNSCTHTNKEVGAWWAVDLGADLAINQVNLYNRQDCCAERLHDVAIYTVDAGNDSPSLADATSVCGQYTGPAGAGEVVQVVCAGGTYGQKLVVQIVADDPEYLTLCEVAVYAAPGSAAAGQPTSQHSQGWNGDPGRGVDGNPDTNYWGNSCTHTNKVDNPWWAVDLGSSQPISRVTLVNRQDCCSERLHDVRVFTTSSLPAAGSSPDVVAECGTFAGPGGAGEWVNIDCASGLDGQYVVVQIQGNQYLTLCEVLVYN